MVSQKGTMSEAPAVNTISGPETGSSRFLSNGMELEGLGTLNLDSPLPEELNDNEGTGEKFVILSDIFSGVDGTFKKGDVRRLSLLISGYTDSKVDREVVKSRIARIIKNKGMRIATGEEKNATWVEIKTHLENEDVQQIRDEKAMFEIENQKLREELIRMSGAGKENGQSATTPPAKTPENELS